MMRGITKFRCPKCGHIFEAPDIEDNATVFTAPMPCPKCGTMSNQLDFSVGYDRWLRKQAIINPPTKNDTAS